MPIRNAATGRSFSPPRHSSSKHINRSEQSAHIQQAFGLLDKIVQRVFKSGIPALCASRQTEHKLLVGLQPSLPANTDSSWRHNALPVASLSRKRQIL